MKFNLPAQLRISRSKARRIARLHVLVAAIVAVLALGACVPMQHETRLSPALALPVSAVYGPVQELGSIVDIADIDCSCELHPVKYRIGKRPFTVAPHTSAVMRVRTRLQVDNADGKPKVKPDIDSLELKFSRPIKIHLEKTVVYCDGFTKASGAAPTANLQVDLSNVVSRDLGNILSKLVIFGAVGIVPDQTSDTRHIISTIDMRSAEFKLQAGSTIPLPNGQTICCGEHSELTFQNSLFDLDHKTAHGRFKLQLQCMPGTRLGAEPLSMEVDDGVISLVGSFDRKNDRHTLTCEPGDGSVARINNAQLKPRSSSGSIKITSLALDLHHLLWSRSSDTRPVLSFDFTANVTAKASGLLLGPYSFSSDQLRLNQINGEVAGGALHAVASDGLHVVNGQFERQLGSGASVRLSGVQFQTGPLALDKYSKMFFSIPPSALHASAIDVTAGAKTIHAELSKDSSLKIDHPSAIELSTGSGTPATSAEPISIVGTAAMMRISEGNGKLLVHDAAVQLTVTPGESAPVKGTIQLAFGIEDVKRLIAKALESSKLAGVGPFQNLKCEPFGDRAAATLTIGSDSSAAQGSRLTFDFGKGLGIRVHGRSSIAQHDPNAANLSAEITLKGLSAAAPLAAKSASIDADLVIHNDANIAVRSLNIGPIANGLCVYLRPFTEELRIRADISIQDDGTVALTPVAYAPMTAGSFQAVHVQINDVALADMKLDFRVDAPTIAIGIHLNLFHERKELAFTVANPIYEAFQRIRANPVILKM